MSPLWLCTESQLPPAAEASYLILFTYRYRPGPSTAVQYERSRPSQKLDNWSDAQAVVESLRRSRGDHRLRHRSHLQKLTVEEILLVLRDLSGDFRLPYPGNKSLRSCLIFEH